MSKNHEEPRESLPMTPTQGSPPAYMGTAQGNAVQHQLVTMQPGEAGTLSRSRRGNWKWHTAMGITQVVVGSLTAILGIVTVIVWDYGRYFSDHGSPIWCGLLFYVVTGILGMVSGCAKKSSAAAGYMVMSILSCLAACCVIGYSSAALVVVGSRCRYPSYHPYDSYEYYPSFCYSHDAYRGIYATLIVLAVLEFIISIIGASMTCSVVYNREPAAQTVIHYQAQPHVVVTGQPQGAVVYNSPAAQPQLAAYQPLQANPLGLQAAGYQYPQAALQAEQQGTK